MQETKSNSPAQLVSDLAFMARYVKPKNINAIENIPLPAISEPLVTPLAQPVYDDAEWVPISSDPLVLESLRSAASEMRTEVGLKSDEAALVQEVKDEEVKSSTESPYVPADSPQHLKIFAALFEEMVAATELKSDGSYITKMVSAFRAVIPTGEDGSPVSDGQLLAELTLFRKYLFDWNNKCIIDKAFHDTVSDWKKNSAPLDRCLQICADLKDQHKLIEFGVHALMLPSDPPQEGTDHPVKKILALGIIKKEDIIDLDCKSNNTAKPDAQHRLNQCLGLDTSSPLSKSSPLHFHQSASLFKAPQSKGSSLGSSANHRAPAAGSST